MLLALDTCFNGCSAALYDEARGCIVASRFQVMERGHAEALGPMVEAVLAEAGVAPTALRRIAVTRGPGTFTGLRIGLAYAKGMALALNIPLIGLDSLTATAAPHFGAAGKLAVVQRAGATGLFYVATFDRQNGDVLQAPALADETTVRAILNDLDFCIVGSGSEAFATSPAVSNPWPDARAFAAYAASLAITHQPVEPLYLRAPDAKPSAKSAASAVVEVHLATAGDIPALADMHQQSFDLGWTASSFVEALSLPGAFALVIRLAGQPYGFVQAQWVAGEAEIHAICVLPNYRRQHFGRDLLQALLDHLQSLDTRKVFLEVSETNSAARALYAHFGFVPTGLRRNYYADGSSAITMTRELVV